MKRISFVFLFFCLSFAFSLNAADIINSAFVPTGAVELGSYSRSFPASYDTFYGGGTWDGFDIRSYRPFTDSYKYLFVVSASVSDEWYSLGFQDALEGGNVTLPYNLFTFRLYASPNSNVIYQTPEFTTEANYSILLTASELDSFYYAQIFHSYCSDISITFYQVPADTPLPEDPENPDPENPDPENPDNPDNPDSEIKLEIEFPDVTDFPSLQISTTADNVQGVIRDMGEVSFNLPSEGTFSYPTWEFATPAAGAFHVSFGEGLNNATIKNSVSTLASYVRLIIYTVISFCFYIKVFHLLRKNS